MKRLGQLIDECVFEAGVSGQTGIESWFENSIKETLDKYTSYVQYPELIRTNSISLNPLSNGKSILPDDFQSMDFDSVVYTPLNDSDNPYTLKFSQQVFIGENTGPATSYSLIAGALQFYPYGDVVLSDNLQYQYWITPSSLIDGNVDGALKSNIIPDILVETIKMEVLAKASMTLGGKNTENYYQMSKDARVASFGITVLPSMQ